MHTPKLELLIVDDEAAIRMSLTQIFASRGYHVRDFSDAFSALEAIRVAPPDILVSDLNMPGMSGFELLLTVRRHFPEVHIIAMSAAYHGQNVPPGVAADAFYAKGRGNPYLLLDMLDAMKRTPQRAQPALRP